MATSDPRVPLEDDPKPKPAKGGPKDTLKKDDNNKKQRMEDLKQEVKVEEHKMSVPQVYEKVNVESCEEVSQLT